jgi:hypothetical protein
MRRAGKEQLRCHAHDHAIACPGFGRISDDRPESGQKPDIFTPAGG